MSEESQQRASDLRAKVDDLYQLVDAILKAEGVDGVDVESLQRINTLGVKLYGAHFDNGHTFPPVLDNESVTATEASVFTSALLEVVDMDLFELSLWRQWGSN